MAGEARSISRLRFGLASQAVVSVPLHEPRQLAGLRVLVVDDNATNRRILQEVLTNWEVHVTTVASAFEALETLSRMHSEGLPISLVLTDIHMPDMDGLMLAEQIRRANHLAETAIIALTSGSQSASSQRCDELGIAAELLKPVKQSELFNAITVAVTPAEARVHRERPVSSDEMRSMAPLRILLAEDGLANQKLAVGLLKNWGHHVTVANNGREAVDLWSAGPFDLVLMDVQMPELDGIEATKAIREREQETGAHVPIIALTAHALKGDRERCLAIGMDGYVSKPVRSNELFEAIRPFFRQRSSAHATAEVEPQSGVAIDWEAVLDSVAGDAGILREVVEQATIEYPELVAQLDEAIRQADANTVQRVAHGLKGSARIFAATAVEQLSETIETMARDGSLEHVPSVVANLHAAVDQLIVQLTRYLASQDDNAP